MGEKSTLLFRNTKHEEVFDSLADFGFATQEIEFPAKTVVKELATRNVPGEDGERVSYPDRAYLEPYDLDVEFVYKGEEEHYYTTSFTTIRDILLGRVYGDGCELEIYSPWHRIGRRGVHVKEIEPTKFRRMDGEVMLGIKVKFHVSDPDKDILLSK